MNSESISFNAGRNDNSGNQGQEFAAHVSPWNMDLHSAPGKSAATGELTPYLPHLAALLGNSDSFSLPLLDSLPQMDLSHGATNNPDIPPQLQNLDPQKITLTTPAEDAKSHAQPDFYLNSEGKLVANPLAHPSPDGSIKVELEGNNSAKKAEQYANKMQKDTIQYLVEKFKHDNPGAKIPEMWQAVLDASPDPSYSNDGDSQNNNTVSAQELQSYNEGQPAPANLPPPDSKFPQTIPEGEPGGGAPNSGPGAGSGSGRAIEGGSPDGHFSPSGTQSNLPNQVTGNGGAPTDGLQISSGSMANYDGDTSHMSTAQMAIISEANKDLGQAMWGGWSGANAEEGCAASVSQILNNSGAASLHNAGDDNCDHLQADLLAQGWTLTDKPQPGDVWIGRGGASDMHTGIVGENNTLMDNHSSNGLFSKDGGGMTNEWNHSVFLKPPDVSNNQSVHPDIAK